MKEKGFIYIYLNYFFVILAYKVTHALKKIQKLKEIKIPKIDKKKLTKNMYFFTKKKNSFSNVDISLWSVNKFK